MKLDLTSFAFGFAINGSNGNPNWATALGQGALYKINAGDSVNEILKGVIYTSVPLSLVRAKIGKGGRVYEGTDPNSGIVLGGVFDQIYVNGIAVPDCKIVIILTRDMTQSHEGRLRLKYSPHNTVLKSDGNVAVSNAGQFDKIRRALGLSEDACWFVYEMEVVNQDQLHLSVGIANPNDNESYASTADLHKKWNEIIVASGGTPVFLSSSDNDNKESLQLITYGAPGTGKSHGIEEKVKEIPDSVERTTFHPDSDYSTFVGAYKPSMESEVEEKVNEYLTIDQLAQRLKDEYNAAGEGSDKGKALAVDLFAEEYYEYLDGAFGKVSLAELVSKAGMTKGYVVGLRDSINVAKYHALQKKGKTRIVYKFVAQAFTKAYVKAWQLQASAIQSSAESAEPVYLVIEEINRGNCAQAFGDIFQLLDRENGYSKYPIKADEDLRQYLAEEFKGLQFGPEFAKVQSGEELVLPKNLYIRATMNTSDQSLFPMDSAFKRRWDWEYVPIADKKLGWYIKVGTDNYKWWSFLEKVNDIVYSETLSADKQMGYFFVKLPEGKKEIDLDKFVNKVAFYLWNDVFKDCEARSDALKLKDEKGNPGEPIKFLDFFEKHSANLNEKVVRDFLDGLGVEKEKDPDETGGTPAAGGLEA